MPRSPCQDCTHGRRCGASGLIYCVHPIAAARDRIDGKGTLASTMRAEGGPCGPALALREDAPKAWRTTPAARPRWDA